MTLRAKLPSPPTSLPWKPALILILGPAGPDARGPRSISFCKPDNAGAQFLNWEINFRASPRDGEAGYRV